MSNIKFDGLDIADSLAASYYTALKICCQNPTFCWTYLHRSPHSKICKFFFGGILKKLLKLPKNRVSVTI